MYYEGLCRREYRVPTVGLKRRGIMDQCVISSNILLPGYLRPSMSSIWYWISVPRPRLVQSACQNLTCHTLAYATYVHHTRYIGKTPKTTGSCILSVLYIILAYVSSFLFQNQVRSSFLFLFPINFSHSSLQLYEQALMYLGRAGRAARHRTHPVPRYTQWSEMHALLFQCS